MKRNQAFTLVELIIVISVFSVVTLFFWQVIDSASKDTSTITDKVEVQSVVTTLMNRIQKDIQEAIPINGTKNIFVKIVDEKVTINEKEELIRYYIINKRDGCIKYEFDNVNKNVKRAVVELDGDLDIIGEDEVSQYDNIKEFLMNQDGLGASIKIIGGKNHESEVDKSRYELNSSYYTRNTVS